MDEPSGITSRIGIPAATTANNPKKPNALSVMIPRSRRLASANTLGLEFVILITRWITTAVTGPPLRNYDFTTRAIGGSRSPHRYPTIRNWLFILVPVSTAFHTLSGVFCSQLFATESTRRSIVVAEFPVRAIRMGCPYFGPSLRASGDLHQSSHLFGRILNRAEFKFSFGIN